MPYEENERKNECFTIYFAFRALVDMYHSRFDCICGILQARREHCSPHETKFDNSFLSFFFLASFAFSHYWIICCLTHWKNETRHLFTDLATWKRCLLLNIQQIDFCYNLLISWKYFETVYLCSGYLHYLLFSNTIRHSNWRWHQSF